MGLRAVGGDRQRHGRHRGGGLWRARWAAVGAAIAIALSGGGVWVGHAVSSAPSEFVGITPVRVLDTRRSVGLTGPFTSPVSRFLDVTGSIPTTAGSQTVVPDGATAVSLNVTVVRPEARGFVSVRPGDSPGVPSTSSLNLEAGETVANAVTVQLPTSGPSAGWIELTFNAYGVDGPLAHVLVDVVGYHQPATAGPAGPPGPPGLAAWEVIPSGTTVAGNVAFDGHETTNGADYFVPIDFPARTPLGVDETDVNFSPDGVNTTVDDDPQCTGSLINPTAPAGKVCIYLLEAGGVSGARGEDGLLPDRGFAVSFFTTGVGDTYLYGVWAYTAP